MPLLRISRYETEQKKRVTTNVPINLYQECQEYSNWVGAKSFNHFVVEALSYILEQDMDWVAAKRKLTQAKLTNKKKATSTAPESVTPAIPESSTAQESVTPAIPESSAAQESVTPLQLESVTPAIPELATSIAPSKRKAPTDSLTAEKLPSSSRFVNYDKKAADL